MRRPAVAFNRSAIASVPRRVASSVVFRVGTIRVLVLIVGRTTEGAWAGVKTLAVET